MAYFAILSAVFAAAFLAPASAKEASLGPEVRQLIVAIAPGWDSPSGNLMTLERDSRGRWQAVKGPVPVLFGRNGLAWGRGVLGTAEPGRTKVERDGRAPAGVFRIGKIYTHDAALPKGSDYPYRTITKDDAWVDDPELPQYNRHVIIDPANPPPWFEKQKMRHNDFAYRWLVEVRHNADPPVPNLGSAIFFHIRRGKTRPTAGCTTMAEEDLASMIRWLRADRQPHYALLPWKEYLAKWEAWGLPNPALIGKMEPK